MAITKQTDLDSAGTRAFVTKDDYLVSNNAFAAGGEDKPTIVLPGSPDTVALWEDFLGDQLPPEWAAVEGDTGHSAAVGGGLINGIARLSISATTGVGPGAVNALLCDLNWRAGSGRLRFAARVRASVLSSANLFVGLTDSEAAEMPAYDTGGGIITQAADCIGFLYGAAAGTPAWRGVSARSVAGDSGDPTPVVASSGPSVGKYNVLEFKVDGGNLATFWLDGRQIGSIPNPIDPGVSLTPVVAAFVHDTGPVLVDTDYVAVSAARDTGS